MYRPLFQMDPHTSSLVDTLCLQISYTRADSNSLALLEILSWRITQSISEVQFSELYRQWLCSKGVFDITKSRQVQTLNKKELLNIQCPIPLQEKDLSKAVRLLNQEYNKMYLELNKDNSLLIQAIERLFQAFDNRQVYHLKRMQILVFYELLLISRVYILRPTTIQNLWKSYLVFQKQINVVDGRFSQRALKNYIIENLSPEEVETVLRNVDFVTKYLILFSDCIKVWRRTQRELTGNNQSAAIRTFEQNQGLFLKQGANSDEVYNTLASIYGEAYLAIHNIDVVVVQSFLKVVDPTIKKHLNQIIKIIQNQDSQTPSLHAQSSKTKTIKIKQSVSSKKSLVKLQSMKTPKKASQEVFTPSKTKVYTPRKSTNARMVSPLPKSKAIIQPPEHQSPSTSNILQTLTIFKNQRIQSFQSVMKRLRRK